MIIFNEAKPKYEKLDELFEQYLNDIRFANNVNIIIDLKEILRKFFRPDITLENFSSRSLIEEISSDVINIIAHYRNYFYKKGKFTNFYFLYSFSKCEEILKEFPDYKKEYYEKYFNEADNKSLIIKKAAQVVQKVVNVIPHAIFIDTSKYDEFIYAKYICTTVNENEMTIILSNDDIFCQLLDKHIFILNLKGIKSNLLITKNCINILTKKEDYNFSSALIPFILSISGNNKTSIKSIPSIGLIKACNITKKLLDENKIIDADSINFPLEFSKLNEKNKMEKMLIDNKELLIKNYNFIRQDNILYSNKLFISNEFIVKKKIGDGKYFANLNAQVFSIFPLQIDMILRGEKI